MVRSVQVSLTVSKSEFINPNKVKNPYPPSTMFQGSDADLKRMRLGGISFYAAKTCMLALTEFMNAIERGDEIEVTK